MSFSSFFLLGFEFMQGYGLNSSAFPEHSGETISGREDHQDGISKVGRMVGVPLTTFPKHWPEIVGFLSDYKFIYFIQISF